MQQELFRAIFARVHPEARVSFVEDGSQIVDRLDLDQPIVPEVGDPDIYFVDLCGTGISGPKLIRALRSHPRTQRFPIIALSGVQATEEIDACFNAGASAYFIKPMKAGELDTILATVRDTWLTTGLLPPPYNQPNSNEALGNPGSQPQG